VQSQVFCDITPYTGVSKALKSTEFSVITKKFRWILESLKVQSKRRDISENLKLRHITCP